ncbi:MAG: hypothetical protein KC635_03475 [Myxococcales bacterium]|nr:hypothetical protein [Myxococcales bacterium]
MRHIPLLLSLVSLAAPLTACGSKDTPAPEGGTAPPPAETAPTGTTTDPAPPPVVGAVDAGAVKAPPEETAAPPEETAAPPEETAAPPDEPAAADPTAAPGEPFVAPPGTPEVRGVEPEVVARVMTGALGCVGIAKNGRSVLSIGEDEAGKVLLIQATSGDPQSWPLGDDLAALVTGDDVAKALRVKAFAPCRTIEAGAGPVVVPKAVPVTVRENEDGWVEAGIEGNRAVPVRRAPYDAARETKLVAVYWSESVGALWVRLRDAEDEENSYLEDVQPQALGEPACVPRPVGGKAPEAEAPPAFDPKPAQLNCVAMTPDGQKAAFKTFFVSKSPDVKSRPNAIEWFGPGDRPDIDLTCMLRGCKDDDLARVTADAERLGLVGCAAMRGKVVVDGQVVPFMTGGDVVAREKSVALKTGGGWRPVHKLSIGGEAGDHEEVWRTFQLPSGGPIYLYVGNSTEQVEQEDRIYVLDDAAMNLCPAPPAGVLPAFEVKVSAAQKDVGGYRFAAANLTDGDLTNGWQAPTWKEGQPGPWVEVVLGGEHTVTAVEIGNGWQRRDGNGDLFGMNARAAEVTLTFGDGATETVTLPDERGMHRVELAAPKQTDRVRITVTKLYEGSAWPRDLSLAEVQIIGR